MRCKISSEKWLGLTDDEHAELCRRTCEFNASHQNICEDWLSKINKWSLSGNSDMPGYFSRRSAAFHSVCLEDLNPSPGCWVCSVYHPNDKQGTEVCTQGVCECSSSAQPIAQCGEEVGGSAAPISCSLYFLIHRDGSQLPCLRRTDATLPSRGWATPHFITELTSSPPPWSHFSSVIWSRHWVKSHKWQALLFFQEVISPDSF